MPTYDDYRKGGEGFVKWAEDNVCIEIWPPGQLIAKWTPIKDLPTIKNPETGRSYRDIWNAHKELLLEALRMVNNVFVYRLLVFCWMRGEGKCECRGSKDLMFDGSVKNVEDIVVGDLLMGDDNTPCKVLSLVSGKEEMFEVVPMRGESMVVTADHMLSLKRRCAQKNKRGKPYNDIHAGKIIDITVKEVMEKSKSWRGLNLLYKVPLNWPEQAVPFDPYFLGLWLGDGSRHDTAVTTMDREIVDYLYAFAGGMGMGITVHTKSNGDNKASTYRLVTERGKKNPLLDLLRNNNLLNNKHIPDAYKINSREVRLQVLAGIVDSDGSKNRNSICILQKSKKLSEDILFLARSLGFHAQMKKITKGIKSTGFVGEYYRIGISGDCSIIPTILPRKKCPKRSDWKDVLVTGIREIRSVGEQEYYGFMLDGNGRYVKGDFTVTHNSFLAVLIQLWKFFVFPSQDIVFCANSKDQTDWVHYTIAKNIIFNSPALLGRIGKKNIQEKQIAIRDSDNNVVSSLRKVSSFSGILSNINGYSFSEIHLMKKPDFFTEIDGSIRNVPNAIGVIDSTVSAEDHQLYSLYKTSKTKKPGTDEPIDPTLFFSYRNSPNADYADFWHPLMTQAQLDSYRAKFLFGMFDKYFKNVWSAGAENVFTKIQIDAMGYFGVVKSMDHKKVIEIITKRNSIYDQVEDIKIEDIDEQVEDRLESLEKKLWSVDDEYTMETIGEGIVMANVESLNRIGQMFNTHWSVIAGIDRADPMKTRTGARTILTAMAKGLPGSILNPDLGYLKTPQYFYLMLYLGIMQNHSIEELKSNITIIMEEFDGVDKVCSERWGIWDMVQWGEDNAIPFEIIYPTYDKQKEAFTEYYNAVNSGRFKSPSIFVEGSSGDDILREEMRVFDHDLDTRKFGSPQKKIKAGIQDDAMYANGWAMFGGRLLTIDDFRHRSTSPFYGLFEPGAGNIGNY